MNNEVDSVYMLNNIPVPGYHPFKSQKAKAEFLELYNRIAKRWPVPSETIMADTSYGKTFIRISGPKEAPPLILLHGISTNSLVWMPQIQILSGQFRTYAIDNIYDFGLSIYTKTVSGTDDFMNWLSELFDAIGLAGNLNIMGMSYGAWLTFQYALRFPEKLNKVVLVAHPAVLQANPFFLLRALLMVIPHSFFYKRFMRWFFEDYIKKDRINAEKIIESLFQISRLYKSKPMPNPTLLTDEELSTISVPALCVFGGNEKVYSAQKAVQRINKLAPGIRTEIIPGAGHDLLAVQSELIMNKVMEFLKQG